MLQKIWDWLLSRDSAHSVNNIITGFNATLDKLKAAEAHHAAKSEENGIQIAQLQAERVAAEDEASRANAVARKIASLVGATLPEPRVSSFDLAAAMVSPQQP